MNKEVLFSACEEGNLYVMVEAMKHLKYGVDRQDEHGHTLLFKVCARKHDPLNNPHLKCVEYLVEQGVDLSLGYTNYVFDGERIVEVLCHYGNYQALEYLLKCGLDPNEYNADNETTLIRACVYDYKDGHDLECIKLLLQYGADVNLVDGWGADALFNASEYARKEVIQALIDAGSDVNSRNNRGVTPLEASLSNEHEGCTELLLYNGATDTEENLKLMLEEYNDSKQMTDDARDMIKGPMTCRKKSPYSASS